MRTARILQANELRSSLAALGLPRGAVVLLHSALSSLGEVAGGAPALIETLLNWLGPEGTLVVPTLPDITQPFSVADSASTVGLVSEVARRWPGAIRSRHPTHAVVAIGAEAETLTSGHEAATPCGIGSPYARIGQLAGWVLLLGVDQDRNTTWHTAETIAGVPYLRTLTVPVRLADGDIVEQRLPFSPWGHREFIKLDRPLRQAGLLRLGLVGQAVARLMPAQGLIDWGVARLAQDPAAFLCDKPRCVFCLWARASIRGNSEQTDWAALSHQWGCSNPRCEVCVV